MNLFLNCFAAGAACLLGFLLFFHPLHKNIRANRWLGLFTLIVGSAFVASYMIATQQQVSTSWLFKCLNCLQYLLAPSLYISILYFTSPTKKFQGRDWLHFLPFAGYCCAELIWLQGRESFSTFVLFHLNDEVYFLVRDLLPFLLALYLVKSFAVLLRHRANLKHISSSVDRINLNWLMQFLMLLAMVIFIWINDAFFQLPLLSGATTWLYTIALFFLAYFSIKQETIFAFREKDIPEISAIIGQSGGGSGYLDTAANKPAVIELENPAVQLQPDESKRQKRLREEDLEGLGRRLTALMEVDRLYLDNELNLATLAEKLGIGIHETSFLINETTGESFFNFINRFRVEEAKKLLASPRVGELNILGIAFAAGFNSKTAFNTAFKKWTGTTPSQYIRTQKSG